MLGQIFHHRIHLPPHYRHRNVAAEHLAATSSDCCLHLQDDGCFAPIATFVSLTHASPTFLLACVAPALQPSSRPRFVGDPESSSLLVLFPATVEGRVGLAVTLQVSEQMT